jgi:NAD(P)-dependent dehydrogenase (short-subunit alcohol dehydrogenase family)
MAGFAGVSERMLAGRGALVVGGSRGVGRDCSRTSVQAS